MLATLGEAVRGSWGAGLGYRPTAFLFHQAGAYTYSVPVTWKVLHQMLERDMGNRTRALSPL